MFLQGFPIWAYTLWAVAAIWLISVFLYIRQRVNIDILSCELHPAVPFSSLLALSNIPHSVTNKPQMFTISFDITYNILDQAMEEQQADGMNIGWLLSASMRSADWLYPGFTIPVGLVKNGQVERLAMKGRIRKATKKRKEGLGINRKQFHELLKKTSQPNDKKPKSRSDTVVEKLKKKSND